MNPTRKTAETNIAKLIGIGDPLPYTLTFNHTLTDQECRVEELELPKALATLTHTAPQSAVCEFGDGTLGIEIDGKVWAVEQPSEERGCLKGLSREVWQYLELAMGRELEGVKFGDTSWN